MALGDRLGLPEILTSQIDIIMLSRIDLKYIFDKSLIILSRRSIEVTYTIRYVQRYTTRGRMRRCEVFRNEMSCFAEGIRCRLSAVVEKESQLRNRQILRD